MADTEHLGLILASFFLSSATLIILSDGYPNLQKSFNSTQVGTSTTGTWNCLAKANTNFL